MQQNNLCYSNTFVFTYWINVHCLATKSIKITIRTVRNWNINEFIVPEIVIHIPRYIEETKTKLWQRIYVYLLCCWQMVPSGDSVMRRHQTTIVLTAMQYVVRMTSVNV